MLGRIVPGTPSTGEVIAALDEAVAPASSGATAIGVPRPLSEFGPPPSRPSRRLVRTRAAPRARNEDRIIQLEGTPMAAGSLAKIAPRTKSAGEVIAELTEVVQSYQSPIEPGQRTPWPNSGRPPSRPSRARPGFASSPPREG